MDDLNALAADHLARARDDAHGRSAHLLFVSGQLRQTVIALTAGSRLDEHNAPPAASVQVLKGRIRLTAGSGDQELADGQLHPVPRERHGVTAQEDSVLLLTTVVD